MAQRRRYATRDELVDLLARRLRRKTGGIDCPANVAAMVDHLAALGVDVYALVKLAVDEADVATYPMNKD